MAKYIKNRILLAQSPANLSLDFQAVSSSSLGVTFAGCPDTSSDARGQVNISEREEGDGSLFSESNVLSSDMRETISRA